MTNEEIFEKRKSYLITNTITNEQWESIKSYFRNQYDYSVETDAIYSEFDPTGAPSISYFHETNQLQYDFRYVDDSFWGTI